MKNKYKICIDIVFSLFLVILFVSIASFIGIVFFNLKFPETNIVIVYILFVLLISRLIKGYIYGVLSAILSTAIYNYLFTEPYFTFKVQNFEYIVTFVIMTIVSIITSAMTSDIKKNMVESQKKEKEMRILYYLSNSLSNIDNIHDVSNIIIKTLYDIFSFDVGFLCFNEMGIPEKLFIKQVSKEKQIYEEYDDKIINEIIKEKKNYYNNGLFYYPIYGRNEVLGILQFPMDIYKNFNCSEIKLLKLIIENISIVMDRLKEEKKYMKSKEEIIQERYRGTLLRSISHDLRTPLTGIIGISEILMDISKDNREIYSLSYDIYKNTNWLKSIVENILSLTKIQDGELIKNKEYESVEELVGSSILHFKSVFIKNKIILDLPNEIIMVIVDGKLIVQVIVNLLDNAIKYSEEGSEIIVKVRYNNLTNEVEISVIDEGIGISKEDFPYIFDMFYTSKYKSLNSIKGIGLGLSICDAIITAHGGKIIAKNREDRSGAIIKFTLPAEVEKYE